ncbi:MAG: hypothetical protein WBO55_08595 [Rhizobiaceae bacterium]
MAKIRNILCAAALAAMGCAVAVSGAKAYETFPDCGAGSVKARIIDKFNWADRHTWYQGLTLDRIEREYERRVELFGPYPIERRYCRAVAWLSDGHRRTVHYRIERGMGLAGTGYKVEFCVQGHDRWYVYGGNCRTVRR